MIEPRLSAEVATAIAEGRPVVALESTIISHGMPYPRNVEMAVEVEQIVRDHGATPATIAVLRRRAPRGPGARGPRAAGLRPRRDQGQRARPAGGARRGAATAPPRSRRPCAWPRSPASGSSSPVVSAGCTAAPSRASTSPPTSPSWPARRSAVVSAGVKSILDIALTLEALETLGVPVLVVGADEFPSFYSRTSGQPRRTGVEDGRRRRARDDRDLGPRPDLRDRGRLPDPGRRRDPRRRDRRDHRHRAGRRRPARDHTGKDVTPYLLGRIVELTGGRSLEANIALVRANARLGAEIAVEHAALGGLGPAGAARARHADAPSPRTSRPASTRSARTPAAPVSAAPSRRRPSPSSAARLRGPPRGLTPRRPGGCAGA